MDIANVSNWDIVVKVNNNDNDSWDYQKDNDSWDLIES